MILHTYLSAAFRGAVEGALGLQPLVQRDRGLIETARQPLKVFVNSALKCALTKVTPGKNFFWLFQNVLYKLPPCPVGHAVTTVLIFCLKLCGRK